MWVLFGLFATVLLIGVALGVAWIARRGNGGGRAREILGERLAKSDISPEDYSERLQMLGRGQDRRRRAAASLALAFAVIGLVGALSVTAAGIGPMRNMMSDGMGMMGSGRPGRSGPDPSPGARSVRVVARDFYFQPGQIRMSVGQTVNIEFEDQGQMFHTFFVGELSFELRVNPGRSISGGLRADRAGTYTFICSVPGHAQLGMRGLIVVTP